MKRMDRIGLVVVALVGVTIGTGLGYWYGGRVRHESPGVQGRPSTVASEPVAKVRVISLRRGRIEETLTAYGTVVVAPGKTKILSIPFESRVLKILVANGQVIGRKTPLMEIEPSADARLRLEEAYNEWNATKNSVKLIKERLKLKLTTRQELLRAKQGLRSAELRVESLKRRGIDGRRVIRAESPGVVSGIDAEVGQLVPAGGALLRTIGRDQITVRLGIENEDVRHLKVGRAVRVVRVSAPDEKAVEGRIDLITRHVNPRTRLVDVFVKPASSNRLLLNEYVQGRIVIASRGGFVVPRAAVLPERGRNILYTVDHGRAVRHLIAVGLQNDRALQVMGEGLQEGQPVVIIGNSELRDGMPVEAQPSR